MTRRALCRSEAVPEGAARGFPGPPGALTGLVLVRRGGALRAYLDTCPHLGLSLSLAPDRYLDGRGEHLVCSAHGARFRVSDGFCVSGPCAGEALEAVAVREEAGEVSVPEEAGL